MPIDPSIIGNVMAPQAVQLPDVNAMMRTQTQGMENIYQIEAAREAQAAEQAKAQEAEAIKALSPAIAAAFEDPSDAGLDAAFSLVPEAFGAAADEQLTQLRAIPDINRRKAVIRSALLQDDYGRALLAQLEPTANMRLQEATAGRRAALDERRLALEEARLAAEANGEGKIVKWVENDVGDQTGLDAQGNIVTTVPGIGKKTAVSASAKGGTEEAKSKVDDTLSDLLASYKKLNKGGAIVSTENSTIGNIAARTGAALGPSLGRAVGTIAQTERDYIQNLRTDLIRDIKLATGMSSQELNSNFELQSALDALGDPYSQSFQTAIRTIEKLSSKYGLGNIKTTDSEDMGDGGGISEGTTATNPQTGERIIYRDGQWQPL
jgi:hypothetical protein